MTILLKQGFEKTLHLADVIFKESTRAGSSQRLFLGNSSGT